MEDDAAVNFNIDPHKVPTYYVDSYLIGSNDNIVTFIFAQGVPKSTSQTVVSRVAMTRNQVKEFLLKLNEHVEKYEI